MSETDLLDELPPITIYWRPGCPFCIGLEHSMKKTALPYSKRNIWDDPKSAAFVRSVADGNEVVPTVTVGTQALVNPSVAQIIQALGRELPDSVSASDLQELTNRQGGALSKLVRRILSD